MPLENYKPTAAQRRSILAGYAIVEKYARSEWEVNRQTRDEARGYGNTHDRVPRIAAQALLSKWFLDGVNEPGMLARYLWSCRSACIWATGLGIEASERITGAERVTLVSARKAHDAAFAACQERTSAP